MSFEEIAYNQILKHVEDFLQLRNLPYNKTPKGVMFECPFCHTKPFSAHYISTSNVIHCFVCKNNNPEYTFFTLKELVKKIDNVDPEDIYFYIKTILKLDVETNTDKEKLEACLQYYTELGFDLVPIKPNDKIPIEKEWTEQHHIDIKEWKDWILKGYNIGVKTGQISKITVIDIDTKEIPKEIDITNTLVQETNKGFHIVYKYESDLSTGRLAEINIDICNDLKQVVIYPSKIDNFQRTWIDNSIPKQMPKETKDFLLTKLQERNEFKNTVQQTVQESKEILKCLAEEKSIPSLEEGEGRNDFFIKFGGKIRQFLNKYQTEQTLKILDNSICNPPLGKELQDTIMKSIEKYTKIDYKQLEYNIIEYLKIANSARKDEIELALYGYRLKGEEKKNIDKVLIDLILQRKIIKKRNEYSIINDMDWKDTLLDAGNSVHFQVPYFHNFAYFNQGDLIVIGAKTGVGKSTISVNILKRLIQQGIKPYYIYSESGGRFGKNAIKIGIKEGEFYRTFCSDPEIAILPRNSVIIYDWVCPNDYAKTDKLYNNFVTQLEEKQSLMFCFVQLRDTNDAFFAPDMIKQFSAFACKYLYNDNTGDNSVFVVEKARDPKFFYKTMQIPCKYNSQTLEVNTVEELELKKKETL